MSQIQQILEAIQKSNEVMSTNVVKIAEDSKKTREVLEEQNLQSRTQERKRKANALKQSADKQADINYELTQTVKQILAAITDLDVGSKGGGGILDTLKNLLPGAGKQTGGYVHKPPAQAFQSGGGVYTVPGHSTGDNHRMMLPAGSFVLNREASKYLQSGGQVSSAMPLGPAPDMVPVKTESQEMIFGPGSWNSLIPVLNNLVPRFQSGGYVGSSNVQDIGKVDYKGRPIKLEPGAAAAFKQMIKDGMPFKPGDVNNVYRDEKEYLRLKSAGYSPASNSKHNYGEAADIQGGMNAWIRKHGAKYGWKANDYAEGTNWHFEYHGAGGSKSTPPAGQKETKKTEDFVEGKPPTGAPSPVGDIQKSGVDGGPSVPGSSGGIGGILSGLFQGFQSIFSQFGAKNADHMGRIIWQSLMTGQGLPGLPGGGGAGGGGGGANTTGAMAPGGGAAGMMSHNKGSLRNFGANYKEQEAALFAAANGGGQSAPAAALPGGVHGKAKMMHDYIVSKGYSSAQAKGIVANIHRESTFRPSVRSGDDGGPGGLFQWKGVRQTPEVHRLVDSGDWKGQIDYALKEDVGPQYKSATAGMNAYDASMWWAEKWERPASLSNAHRKHSKFLPSYKFQDGGMVPVKVESGEKIFMPGTFGPEISALNDAIPRFQNGGTVGNCFSNSPTMVADRFNAANVMQNSQQAAVNQPIVVPMPVVAQGENPGGGIEGGSETMMPELTQGPSNYLASALLMQSHALMQRIG